MKARIIDADALRAISPAALSAFARNAGWSKTDNFGTHASIYTGVDLPEIILPRTDQLADYAAAVSRVLSVFAQITGRDEFATYRDLVGADRDVVRVRVIGTDDDDGAISLDAGVEIVAQAREMLLAAACAAKTPQSLFRAGANKEAIDYIRNVKLGQTEHGSFVVTLLAPVPPLLQPFLDPAWMALDEEPMERIVTRRLMDALDALRNAAELAVSGEVGAFDQAVAAGVSANLCEALVGLIEHSSGIDISVTWARTRPMPDAVRKVGFSVKDAAILKEAARNFRLRQPRPDMTLYGTVNKLSREQDQFEGMVTFKAIVDDKIQSVRAMLDQQNYDVAVRAHRDKTQVVVTGDLERVGQRWVLLSGNVRELLSEDTIEEPGD